jgi:DMSO/TMAO reductase YedYZ molybdopterin-dependent catalytic subunit
MNDKLIEAKRQWAREGRLLTGTVADPEHDRLPPGQLLVRDWPVLDLGAEPDVTPQKFRLDIDGAVENRLSLSLDEFMALPQSESTSDIHCVTQWSALRQPLERRRGARTVGDRAAEAGGTPCAVPQLRRLYGECAAGAVRSA